MIYKPMFSKRAILDLRGLVLHSYYGGTPVDTVLDSTGKRIPTAGHAVRFFTENYLTSILHAFAPVQIIAVLEGGNGKARRQAFYPSYKSKESSIDPVMKEQQNKSMDLIQRLLMGLGALLVKTTGVEADDTIAFLVRRLASYTRIYTVDKDLQQLHSAQCGIYLKNQYTTVFEGHDLAETGGWVVALHKSIVGDSSDGYVGVKGMGPSAWKKLVDAFGMDGMEDLLGVVKSQDWDTLQAAVRESGSPELQKLLTAREEWHTSYKLAILHDEWCELSHHDKITRPQWIKRLPSLERVKAVLEPLGLMRLVDTCGIAQYMPTMTLVEDQQQEPIQLLLSDKATPFVAFDWESFDSLKHAPYREARSRYVDVKSQVLTGGSFCWGSNLQHSIYVPVDHRDTKNWESGVLAEIMGALEEKQMPTVAHNAKFEQTLLITNFGYEFPVMQLPADTSILASHVNENEEAGLKLLSKAYLNYTQASYSDVVPDGKDMRDVSGAQVLNYGADDSFVTAHLCVLFRTILECEGTDEFAVTVEPYFDLPMIESFLKGIPINYEKLSELEKADKLLLKNTEANMRQLLKDHCSEFNEQGFATLWPEVKDFQTATLKSKGKEAEEIVDKLEELKKALAEKCKYVHIEPPATVITRAALSEIAKAVGFTAIRSLKKNWIADYYRGMLQQLEEFKAQDPSITLTEDQHSFLYYLEAASGYLEMASVLSAENLALIEDENVSLFRDWISDFYVNNPALWNGDELNVGSSQQMAEVLYGKMGLPILIRNLDKNEDSVRSQYDLEGAPSTNEIALRTLLVELPEDGWQHQVLQDILVTRGARTRFSLYYKPYPLWQHPNDGCIHPSTRNCGTVTRRPSGSAPNIYQVSKKDGGQLRSVFLPQPNDIEPEVIVSIDFVQQELVIMAGVSGDKNLRACYEGNNRKDVHSQTGAAIMNMANKRSGKPTITYEEFEAARADPNSKLHSVAEKMRKKYAKTTNFLLSYGGSAVGLARKIIVSKPMAEEFLDAFHGTYPKVREFQDRAIADAKKYGYVKTAYGNRKHCDGIFDKNKGKASAWERQAINMEIQGCAADILKYVIKMMVLKDVFSQTGATLYAPVYDELVSSVPRSKVFEYCQLAADAMEITIPNINITLSTSVSIGRNWGEQHEIGTRPTEEIISQTLETLFKIKEAA